MPSAVMVVGHSNTGKTRLVVRLINILAARGYRVAAVKHAAHHGYEIDSEGKDSWQFFKAGAAQVVVVGTESLTVHARYDSEPTLAELGNRMNVDLILAEGFKSQAGPKIEVLRQGFSEGRLPLGDNLVAVVSDIPVAGGVPWFSPDQVELLADFIESRFLKPGGSTTRTSGH